MRINITYRMVFRWVVTGSMVLLAVYACLRALKAVAGARKGTPSVTPPLTPPVTPPPTTSMAIGVTDPAAKTDAELLQDAIRRAAYSNAQANASEHEKYLKSEVVEDKSLTAIAQQILDNRMTSYQKHALYDLLRKDVSQTPVHSLTGSIDANQGVQ